MEPPTVTLAVTVALALPFARVKVNDPDVVAALAIVRLVGLEVPLPSVRPTAIPAPPFVTALPNASTRTTLAMNLP